MHAEPIDFTAEDPVEVMRELTGGVGPDRVVDAVGVDAYPPPQGEEAREDEQARASQGGELAWQHGTANRVRRTRPSAGRCTVSVQGNHAFPGV